MKKLDKAMDALKAQGYGAPAAKAIAEASVNDRQRWFQLGEKYLFVAPQTFLVTEVAQGAVPQGALHVIMPHDITEAAKVETPAVDVTAATTETPAVEAKPETEPTPTETTPVAEVTAEPIAEAMPAGMMGDEPADGDEADPKKKKKKGEAEKDDKPCADAPKESTRTLYLSELTTLTEATVNGETKTVEVTLIKPGWSANGKFYGADMLKRDMGIFEGVKAYADHPSKSEETNRPERSVKDITGYYTNVHQEADGSLKATRHFVGDVGTGTIYPLVVEAITNKPDLMGLSINALGKTKLGEVDGRKGVIVEALVKGNSVDDVTTPAAGGKYDRLLMAGDEFTTDLLQAMEYDEWRESRPDFVARVKNEMRTARKEELTEAAVQEAVTLREQVASLETTNKELVEAKAQSDKDLSDLRAENARREGALVAERKLAESKLPDAWKETIKPQLAGKTAVEIDTVLEAERVKFFSFKQPVPVRESGAEGVNAETVITREQAVISGALGLDPSEAVLEGESPEQWARRLGKIK